ncbi:MAG: SDR family NAD(P)-dependent oxidoreductase [Anaerolineales bacterium]|nr:MAG: SDR family NAD(P)-dependent oxidoreductase [Anaerolineales bacterium]
MRALVTGATGCVGANVVEALLYRGYTVRAMRRSSSKLGALAGLQPEIVTGDVLDVASLVQAMTDCDLVFHVAAISEYWRSSPEQIYHVNVTGTRRVLQAAAQCRIERVVFTSSVSVLGKPSYPGEVLNEASQFSHYPIPFHYGHSKVLAEAEVLQSVKKGLDVVVVNPASVIGQRDVNYIGGELITAAAKGWFFAAPSGGMGIVSAKDVGTGHVLAAESGKTGSRYILNGENIPHTELMKIVASDTDSAAPRFMIPQGVGRGAAHLLHSLTRIGIKFPAIDPIQLYLSTFYMYFDASKAAAELGFRPQSARQAVQEAVSWYKQQGML